MRKNSLAAGLGLFCAAVVHGGMPSFEVSGPFLTDPGPGSLVVVDMNHDGHLDVIAVTGRSVGLQFEAFAIVLLGDGLGGFAAPTYFPFDGLPNTMAVGDLNHDGHPDLVAPTFFNNPNGGTEVRVLLGDGAGNLAFPPHTSRSGGLGQMAILEATGDTNLDLVSIASTNLAVYPGNGLGAFGARTLFPLDRTASFALAMADLNGDGHPDAVAGGDGVSVRLANGDGGFLPLTTYPLAGYDAMVTVGDLNGDNRPDIVAALGDVEDGSTRISVLMGAGAGEFVPGPSLLLNDSYSPSFVGLRDLDGDGRLDLVLLAELWDPDAPFVPVFILPGDGTGGFLPLLMISPGGPSPAPYDVGFGDVNEDGRIDLVVAQRYAGYFTVLLNRPDGGADLGVTKTVAHLDPSHPERVTYTVTVTNVGPGLAEAVVMTDPVPVTNLISAVTTQGTCSIDGNMVVCQLGAMGSGESAVVKITADFRAVGAYTNTAQVTAGTADPVPANNGAAIVHRIENVAEIRMQMPTVVLDRLAYDAPGELSARVLLPSDSPALLIAEVLIVTDSVTRDVEQVLLAKSVPGRLNTTHPLSLTPLPEGAPPVPLDGTLATRPGSIVLAQVAYYVNGDTNRPFAASDFGFLINDVFTGSPVLVEPKIALEPNELIPGPGGKRLTTLVPQGAPLPVQVPVEEVLFRPASVEQLDELLGRTGGQVLETDGLGDRVEEQWHVIGLIATANAARYVDQMRSLVGDEGLLVFSSQEGLNLYATALELWLEGFRVALHPRIQLHDALDTQDVNPPSPFTGNFGLPAYDDSGFGLEDLWLYLAQTDADERTVPVAFVDQGFAPDPDFRGFPDFLEYDVESGLGGPGAATGPPTIGNSFFGPKSWHGNGVVHTAGAVMNNAFGTIGVGGQVVVPRLYRMSFKSYALQTGDAIRRAVDQNASVVNVSFGYPCRVLWTLGPDDICSTEGRAWFISKLTVATETAALAACVVVNAIPFVGQAICAGIQAAAVAGVTLQVASLFVGEVRGPVEDAVAHAVARGVPVVASAGNRLDSATLGPLAPFVDNSPENSTLDAWEVIPAIIPGCLAVGAAEGVTNGNIRYPNQHFHGNRVDLWAPIRTGYFAPPDTTDAALALGPLAHQSESLGGTSAAAPYVSGVIAALMAMHPGLDPRHLAPDERPGNVSRIRQLLLETAHQPDDLFLPSEVTVDNDTRIPDETKADLRRRRNLINPFSAVRRAAELAGIPAFDQSPADFDKDYGRSDSFPDAEPGIAAPTRSLGELNRFSDEIGRMVPEFWQIVPGPITGGADVHDADWMVLRAPDAPGLYSTRMEARIPWHEEGRLVIDGNSGRLERSVPGEERVYAWSTPQVFHGTRIALQLTGREFSDEGADFPYQLTSFPATVQPVPLADAFETPTRNDSNANAVPLVFNPCTQWTEVFTGGTQFSQIEERAFEYRIDGLTMDRANDEDWFALTLQGCLPSNCEGCPPELTVFLNGQRNRLFVEIYDRYRTNLIARGLGSEYLRVTCRDYLGRTPLHIRVRAPDGAAAEYALRFRWSILNSTLCCESAYRQLADHFLYEWRCDVEAMTRRFQDRRLDVGTELLLPIRDPFGPESPRLPDGGLMPDLSPFTFTDRPSDALGRSLRAQTFVVEVGASGRFEALIETGPEDPLLARLWGGGISETHPEAALILEAATPGARDALGLFGGPPAQSALESAVTAPGDLLPPGFLRIRAEGLSAGYYTLALSRFYEGTRATIYLARENQADDLFPTLEDVLNPGSAMTPPPEVGFIPTPPPSQEDQVAKLTWHPAVELSFSTVSDAEYRVSARVSPSGIFADVGRPIRGTGSVIQRFYPMLGPGAAFRVELVGGTEPISFEEAPALELRLAASKAGRRYLVSFSSSLIPADFEENPVGQIVGTGGSHSWFIARPASESGFYLLEDLGPAAP